MEATDLDTAIDTAMSGQDAAALGSLLADDFIYTHSNVYMRYVRVFRQIDARWFAISHRTVYATDRG